MTTGPTAQPTPTPVTSAHRPTVLWQVDVLDEGIDLTDPVAVAVAAYEQIKAALWLPVLRVLLADGTAFDVDLDAPREDAATIVSHTTPTPAPVAVPEGGWRDGDWLALIDGRVWHVSDDALLHDERGRIMDADYVFRRGHVVYVHAPREAYGEPNDTTQHAPRTEPVTAPLPSEAVETLADQVRLAVPAMMPGLAERIAQVLTAAGYTLPAADQRARDEGAVRRAVLDAIEDEGPDTENPASRERIRGWRECAQDVRDALDSVEDDDEGTVRVPREAVERLRRAHEGYIPDTCADAGLDRAAEAVLDGSR